MAGSFGPGLGDSARFDCELRPEGVAHRGVGVVDLLERLHRVGGGEQLEEGRQGALELGHRHGVDPLYLGRHAAHRLDVETEPPRDLLLGHLALDGEGGHRVPHTLGDLTLRHPAAPPSY